MFRESVIRLLIIGKVLGQRDDREGRRRAEGEGGNRKIHASRVPRLDSD